MMMDQFMKDVLNMDMQTVNKQFIFITLAHFIEVKLKIIKQTVKDNYPVISFILKVNFILLR